MEVSCLSVPNPFSYLICAGNKDVENRGFGTDYRGPLYIHSSGRYALRGMPALDGYPVPVIHEFNNLLDPIQEMDRKNHFIGIADGGVHVFLKDENSQSDRTVNEYALLSEVYDRYRKSPKEPYFLVNAIIGKVTLVDVKQNAKSDWAEKGYHHWVLQNAKLFSQPITEVKSPRTGLWRFELPQ